MNIVINYIDKYPVRVLHAAASSANTGIPIFVDYSRGEHWGISSGIDYIPTPKEDILHIEFVWYSVLDRHVYCCIYEINTCSIPDFKDSVFLVAGLSPNGEVALWISTSKCSEILGVMYGSDVTESLTDELVKNLRLKDCDKNEISTLKELDNDCRRLFALESLEKNKSLPPSNLMQKLLQQFVYRYNIVISNVDDNFFDYGLKLSQALVDGTHYKSGDDELLKYHQAGMPKKLAIKWHKKKTEYFACFWFDYDGIRIVFDKFYCAHPETKTDFIIRIDAENQKYELALYRYGLKEPQIIPEEVYQLIVFKNKFEDYRSDNYNQESGAWIW